MKKRSFRRTAIGLAGILAAAGLAGSPTKADATSLHALQFGVVDFGDAVDYSVAGTDCSNAAVVVRATGSTISGGSVDGPASTPFFTGNPFVTGIGPCAILRGTDWGDPGEFNAANGRTCDYAVDKFETYGFRLVSVGD